MRTNYTMLYMTSFLWQTYYYNIEVLNSDFAHFVKNIKLKPCISLNNNFIFNLMKILLVNKTDLSLIDINGEK